MYARLTGKAPFVIYQGAWNVLERDIEREIIPMCRAQGLSPVPLPSVKLTDHVCTCVGMAIAPWNVLAGGKIRTDEEEERRRQSGERGTSRLQRTWKVGRELTTARIQAARTWSPASGSAAPSNARCARCSRRSPKRSARRASPPVRHPSPFCRVPVRR